MPTLRRATLTDIPRLMDIRFAVQENRLQDLTSVALVDYQSFIERNLVWVAEDQARIIGFSACDDRDGTIWALFVDPADQGRGLGVDLLQLACRDLAVREFVFVRLTTDPGTRAERFYLRHGWVAQGLNDDGEMQFEREL